MLRKIKYGNAKIKILLLAISTVNIRKFNTLTFFCSYLDLSDILDDCEGEREAVMSEERELALLSICSTLEKMSELQSDPMLRLCKQQTRIKPSNSLTVRTETNLDYRNFFVLVQGSDPDLSKLVQFVKGLIRIIYSRSAARS
jgi:hypothetical protein